MEIREADRGAQDEDVAARRELARYLLPDITAQVQTALTEAGIGIDVFLLIPSSGDAIATFGTLADVPKEEWSYVADVVCSAIGAVAQLEVWSRPLACATTADDPARGISPAELTVKPTSTSTSTLDAQGKSR